MACWEKVTHIRVYTNYTAPSAQGSDKVMVISEVSC